MASIDESLLFGKIRDKPINDRLRQVLLAAAEDVSIDVVRIVSGGQPGSTGQRTGSTRHDGGNAADLQLVTKRRTLDVTVPGDLQRVQDFVTAAAAHGATGIGAGVRYMGPKTLHVGFGRSPEDYTKLVWGAGGRSANAPPWLRDAARRGWDGPGPEDEIRDGGDPPERPSSFWSGSPGDGAIMDHPGTVMPFSRSCLPPSRRRSSRRRRDPPRRWPTSRIFSCRSSGASCRASADRP